jgi:hypothetical protein
MIRKALLSIFISFCFIQLSFSYELNDSDQKIVASFAYNLNNKASLLSDNEKLNVKVKLTAAITRMKIKYKNNKRIYNILNEIATELKYSKINWTTYTDKEY